EDLPNGKLPKLPDAAVRFGIDLSWTRVKDEALKELAGLKNLVYLNLGGTRVTDAGLKELAGLKNLEMLILGKSRVDDWGQVTDAGLKELAGLKNLVFLDLSNTGLGVTDAGLKELACFENLATLNLDETAVTDAGLKHLAGLKNLAALNLDGTHGDTPVTDAGLKELAGLKNLAARVRQPGEPAMRVAARHHRTNCEGTVRLVEMAAAAGVRRLVFLSTIKVNGKRTVRRAGGSWQRYSEDDVPHPQGAYAQSKWEAEQALLEIAARGPMAVTILRPPLVYGPGVGANFLRLVRSVQKGIPLPFARVVNMRSLVYVENLAEAILVCMESRAATNKTYLVRDVDVSTPDLIYAVARVLGCRPRLIRMPLWALRLGGVLTLRSA
ncbi:MAG: NAD-dependent epimerase/dehydratase family protein, partial [Acidobacteria bacterium]|nr:NAD-dependent epimerase/dehydratase family protein [Acidobacteriota bacterium]